MFSKRLAAFSPPLARWYERQELPSPELGRRPLSAPPMAPTASSPTAPPSALRHQGSSYKTLDTSSCLSRHAALIVVAYLTSSACLFAAAEGWRWTDALWFCTVTLLTIGYGDFVPERDVTKLLLVVYLLLGLSLIVVCLGALFGQLDSALLHGRRGSRRPRLQQVLSGLLGVLLVIGTGTALVCTLEGWKLVDGVYWATVTASTTGFGDLTMNHPLSRMMCTPCAEMTTIDRTHCATPEPSLRYLLIAVGAFAASLHKLGAAVMEAEAQRALDRFVSRGVTRGMLADIGGGPSCHVDRAEFLRFMLVHMGKVQKGDVDKVLGLFEQLDTARTGDLGPADVEGGEAPPPLTPPPLTPPPIATRPRPPPHSAPSRMPPMTVSAAGDLKRPLLVFADHF